MELLNQEYIISIPFRTPPFISGRRDNSPAGSSIRGAWASYTSRDGIQWLGSINGNIFRINPTPRAIPYFPLPSKPNSFYEAPNGDFWIATEQRIIIKEKKNETFKQYELDVTPNNIEDDNVQILREDKQGNIWIGGSGGLSKWDKISKQLTHYKNDPNKNNSLSNNSLITIYEDNKENFWIGSIDGANLMNRSNGTFKKYYMNQVDTSFIGLNIVTSVLKDKRGKLWMGTWNGGGVYLFNQKDNTSKAYLSGTSVVCLYEDSNEELWLGSNYGLFRYNPDIDNFIRYLDPFTTTGISFVAGIVEDNDKYLWISSNSGLARINPERNETNKLGKAYGLGNSNFSFNSTYKGRDGKLYFGAQTGYISFNPAEVILNSEPPEIVITGFRLANNLVKPGNDSPLKQDLVKAKEIRLGYGQNVFSFDYAIIDYVNPDENQLHYFLENFDKNWLQPNSEQRAYYFNIPPGKYTFRVKGANSYGVWAEKKINITILPPWYKTWWAYLIYAVLLIALVLGF